MPRRRSRTRAHRPEGSKSQITNVIGCPHIYRKPFEQDGRWLVRRRLRAAGSRVECITLEAETLGDACAEVLRRAEDEARAVDTTLPPEERGLAPVTFEAGWEAWMHYVSTVRNARPVTVANYRLDGNLYARHFGGATLLHEITLKRLEDFFGTLGAKAGRTREKHANALARFLRYAKRHEWIRRSPLSDFDIPATWRDEAREAAADAGRSLDQDEARRLLRSALAPYVLNNTPIKFRNGDEETSERAPPRWLFLATAIALHSGLRRGNITGNNGLRWGDLDLTPGEEMIRIPAERMKARRRFEAPLHAGLAALLREERSKLRRVPEPDARVLPEVENFYRSWQPMAKRAKLDGLRFHDLRHTLGAWLGACAPPGVQDVLLGHSPLSSMTKRYAKGMALKILRQWINEAVLPLLDESGAPRESASAAQA